MKSATPAKYLFILSFVILVAINALVLTGVAHNRAGEPEAAVELSQRELSVSFSKWYENSGLSLHLRWRALDREHHSYYSYYSHTPEWFDENKLRALGFDLPPDPSRYFRRKTLPRKAFIVLQLGGAPHEISIKRGRERLSELREEFQNQPDNQDIKRKYETARKRFDEMRQEATRLFAVDAGLDPETLRTRYPDHSRYIIAPGIVTISSHYEKNHNTKWIGRISRLSVQSIHVPHRFRRFFQTLQPSPREAPYRVTIAYGNRHEPWIVSVRQ